MSLSLRQRVQALAANPAWISFIRFGMTAGVALLATPASFSAPTISRPVAHAAYSVLELTKLALLAWLGFGALSTTARSAPTPAG